MIEAQLWAFFKDNGITLEELSEKTGYSIRYLLNLLSGNDKLNDKARFRFIRAFPETTILLMDKPPEDRVEEQAGE